MFNLWNSGANPFYLSDIFIFENEVGIFEDAQGPAFPLGGPRPERKGKRNSGASPATRAGQSPQNPDDGNL